MSAQFPASSYSRREMLARLGGGMGLLGLAGTLCDVVAPNVSTALADATSARAGNPMAPKAPHFVPRATRVIHLFMNGGPSQVDTFDPKPELARHAGEPSPAERVPRGRSSGNLLASPFKFAPHGQSGIEVSEIFPHLSRLVDELCVVRSMHTNLPNHEPSLLVMNSGETQPTRPSMGSWLTYGLGTENQNLPGFVVLCPGKPVVGPQLWSSSFLPGIYQGVHINNGTVDPKQVVRHISNAWLSPAQQRRQLDLLKRMNEIHLVRRQQDQQLEARIESLEMAYRMQFAAMDAFDISRETEHTRQSYGDGEFASACLIARRLAERGVRVTQVYYGNGQPWDDHSDIANHKNHADKSDKPIAALLADLKARGLLDETLVLWGGEFGRTPSSEGSTGRDHNNLGFSMWLAGGGVRGGMVHGATDDLGFAAVDKPVHVHDLHATILHLLGIDHERLTFRYSGRDFRLTDVYGNVVREILA